MPEPQWHAALSPAVYAAARAAKLKRPACAAVASVMLDADHVADLAYFRLTSCRDRQLVPFHSWELAFVGLLSRRRTVRAISAGALAHMLADWSIGGYDFLQLSLAYRLAHKFKTFRSGRGGDWVEWPHGALGWKAIFSSHSSPQPHQPHEARDVTVDDALIDVAI